MFYNVKDTTTLQLKTIKINCLNLVVNKKLIIILKYSKLH